MLPVGLLMIEHRLIERVIKLWDLELRNIGERRVLDVCFIDTACDFMRIYADRCHHGKEEDILFRQLRKKPLTTELKNIMEELINKHVLARNTVAGLLEAKDRYIAKDKKALTDASEAIKTLAELYPRHIEKEDKHFFLPVMEYFSKQEQKNMSEEFWAFDRGLIHEKYKLIVEALEK